MSMNGNRKRRIVIVGATSSIAEHVARLWAEKGCGRDSGRDAGGEGGKGDDFILVGRDAARLGRLAQDLRVRAPQASFVGREADFLKPQAIEDLVQDLAREGTIDMVLIAHGSLPEQKACEADLVLADEALQINGVSPVLFAEAFAKQMDKQNSGVLAVIGSVAGDRGRKSNYVYGAAKSLVACYFEGLQHRFAGSNVKVVLIKPGPTDTPMTAHLKDKGMSLAPVEKVAQDIVRGIEAGSPVIYTPRIWQLIMLVIRHIPRFVFAKLNI